jgi:hypothetical protein
MLILMLCLKVDVGVAGNGFIGGKVAGGSGVAGG